MKFPASSRDDEISNMGKVAQVLVGSGMWANTVAFFCSHSQAPGTNLTPKAIFVRPLKFLVWHLSSAAIEYVWTKAQYLVDASSQRVNRNLREVKKRYMTRSGSIGQS